MKNIDGTFVLGFPATPEQEAAWESQRGEPHSDEECDARATAADRAAIHAVAQLQRIAGQ